MVLVDTELDDRAPGRDARELRQCTGRDDRLELGPGLSSVVSFTDSRYESVAAMTSLPAPKRTRIPVSTGRDSSRDAERETRSIVSSSDGRSTREVATTSTSGSRGKSSAA